MANVPRMVPIAEADRPRSCPSTAHRRRREVPDTDTSQPSQGLRNTGSRSRSHAVRARGPLRLVGHFARSAKSRSRATTGDAARAGTRRETPPGRCQTGRSAGRRSSRQRGHRRPGNPCFKCSGVLAARPTCRCRAMLLAPMALPHSIAARQTTRYIGHTAAIPTPAAATTTHQPTGRFKPWRSAKRPASGDEDLCQGKQCHQHACRNLAAAQIQCIQRRRHAHARHGRMQADLPDDEPHQLQPPMPRRGDVIFALSCWSSQGVYQQRMDKHAAVALHH